MDERRRFLARLLDANRLTHVCRDLGIFAQNRCKIFDRFKKRGFLGPARADPSDAPSVAGSSWRHTSSPVKREKPHWRVHRVGSQTLFGPRLSPMSWGEFRGTAPGHTLSMAAPHVFDNPARWTPCRTCRSSIVTRRRASAPYRPPSRRS